MRIELQLVEFERGACAIIPVAATAGRPGLINQLVISRFAISQPPATCGNDELGGELTEEEAPALMCHNDTRPPQRVGENLPPHSNIHPLPVFFADPVAFEVPVVFAN